MNLTKHKMMEKENGHFEGSEDTVAISGGFLDIQIDGSTICTASIPTPNLMAGRYRDSVSRWSENFEDLDGNSYIATTYSSVDGVEWKVDVEPREDAKLSSDEILHNISSAIDITINYTDET